MVQSQKGKTEEGCGKSLILMKPLLPLHGRVINCSLLRRFPPYYCLNLYQLFVLLRHPWYEELTQSSDLQCSEGLDLWDRNTHVKCNSAHKTDNIQTMRPKIWPCGFL